MAKVGAKQYFWNLKGECFGGCGFGEDITSKIEGQTERIKDYLKLGKIVDSEPIDFDHAQQDELSALRKEVENLRIRNAELEKAAKKKGSGSAKLKEANQEIANLKTEAQEAQELLGESSKKIADLETDLEKATKPEAK